MEAILRTLKTFSWKYALLDVSLLFFVLALLAILLVRAV